MDDLDLDPRGQRAVARLRAAHDPHDPPPGLVAATLRAVAARRPAPAADRDPVFAGWLRADVVVAASLAFVTVLVAAAGVAKLRADSRTVACQDRLRTLHAALDGYADVHAGRRPAPGGGTLADDLLRSGHLPDDRPTACPADPAGRPVAFHYTLGYVSAGTLVGPRRDDPDGAPLAADPPAGRSPHRTGQNVLFAGGRVRFATTPAAGLGGDHIYRNDAGLVRAGLRPADAVLGGPTDCP